MDASYKIQRGIHVHLIQFFMCPEFWVHISHALRFFIPRWRLLDMGAQKRQRVQQRLPETWMAAP